MSWAHEPLSRMQAGNMTYQELVSQLEASIQQEREEKEARLKDNLGKSSSHYDEKLSGNMPGIILERTTKVCQRSFVAQQPSF